MRRVFADTSALVALKDASDQHHSRAFDWLQGFLAGPPGQLVLTNYVLSEVHAFFCRTPSVALEYVDHIDSEPLFRVIRAVPRDERSAREVLRRAKDKSYSFADAVSFAVMDRLNIRTAFAFDRHFRQRGFALVP